MKKVAHRGALSSSLENTLTSIKHAIKMKCDMVEIDVRACASGEILVIHDKKLDRTTNGSGLIKTKNYSEIKKLKISEYEKVPTLDEVLKLAKNKILVNIEVKETEIVEAVYNIIKKNDMENKVIVSSFLVSVLKEFKEKFPNIKTGFLFRTKPRNLFKKALEFGVHSLHPRYGIVNKKFMSKAKSNNLKVYPYTVNNKKIIDKLKLLNVDGIISDFPYLI